ncbi:MAG TPA: F0F1 ATP synthase subunit delta [Nocardioidaceae bacterium]|nr:F0F1 ATP synthase subunit delta [Nocardioidaceae bacterium]
MRGASADSLAALTAALDAAVDDGADATRVGEDLFAVARVLRDEPGLRRMVTDVSVDGDAKSGFVRDLFGDQFSAETLDIVAQAVGLRWAGSRDLGDALEELGVVAVVKAADQDNQADRVEDELFAFGRLVTGTPGLRDALSDPARSAADKGGLLHSLLDGKVSSATIRLAEQAVVGMHRTVGVAINEYQKVAAEAHNRNVATVRVARELSEGDLRRLESALEGQYGRKVHLNVLVDPDVVGGIRVEIGEDVIDGTVASRLDDARRRLAG